MSFPLSDAVFLARTLELAARGAGAVAPNPMVGCVIVGADGTVLGEGWHRRYGGAHAEVDAVKHLPFMGRLGGTTVYVSLEPCAHHGKTPPCADMLANLGPARVVAATTDPHPLVAGKGFAKLRAAGINVQEGPLTRQALVQNRRFVGRVWDGRPFVTLKWAETADGYLARADYSSQWITGLAARALGHRARGQHQAIAVGFRTALHDDPRLDARLWPGPSPVRVVVDPHRTLPPTLRVFTDGGPTLHLFDGSTDKTISGPVIGYQPVAVQPDAPGGWPGAILDVLARHDLFSLLVEGGAGLIGQFQAAGLWDEALVFTGTGRFGPSSIPAPQRPGGLPLVAWPAEPDSAALYANPAGGFWPQLEAHAPPGGGPAWQGYL